MAYRIGVIIFIVLVGKNLATPIFAIDRNLVAQGARSIMNMNNTYNLTTVSINSGSVTIGSTNYSLPAYQQIAQITAKMELLRQQLRSLRP